MNGLTKGSHGVHMNYFKILSFKYIFFQDPLDYGNVSIIRIYGDQIWT